MFFRFHVRQRNLVNFHCVSNGTNEIHRNKFGNMCAMIRAKINGRLNKFYWMWTTCFLYLIVVWVTLCISYRQQLNNILCLISSLTSSHHYHTEYRHVVYIVYVKNVKIDSIPATSHYFHAHVFVFVYVFEMEFI